MSPMNSQSGHNQVSFVSTDASSVPSLDPRLPPVAVDDASRRPRWRGASGGRCTSPSPSPTAVESVGGEASRPSLIMKGPQARTVREPLDRGRERTAD
jgi:hypothetical protein